jgi:hypothetical protein
MSTTEEPRWIHVTEDYLLDNFINADTEEQTIDKRVDMCKLDFKPTVYDFNYYKHKFPYFDDGVCSILEKCSIKKTQKTTTPQDKKTNRTKTKGLKIENKRTLINFD